MDQSTELCPRCYQNPLDNPDDYLCTECQSELLGVDIDANDDDEEDA